MADRGGSFEKQVSVWGKIHTITVHHTSKTVWVAIGDYMGERIETKGSSLTSAAAAWVDAARYKGNG